MRKKKGKKAECTVSRTTPKPTLKSRTRTFRCVTSHPKTTTTSSSTRSSLTSTARPPTRTPSSISKVQPKKKNHNSGLWSRPIQVSQWAQVQVRWRRCASHESASRQLLCNPSTINNRTCRRTNRRIPTSRILQFGRIKISKIRIVA